jgi:hypothetical protein
MQTNGNGSTHHHEPIVEKLLALGLVEADQCNDQAAIDGALNRLIDKVAAVQPGRPISNFFISPSVEVSALTYLLLSHLEFEVALGNMPAQVLAAKFVRARSMAQASHAPAGVHQLLSFWAETIDWGLRPHGETINAKAIAARDVR